MNIFVEALPERFSPVRVQQVIVDWNGKRIAWVVERIDTIQLS